jgi:hypothetical protein
MEGQGHQEELHYKHKAACFSGNSQAYLGLSHAKHIKPGLHTLPCLIKEESTADKFYYNRSPH